MRRFRIIFYLILFFGLFSCRHKTLDEKIDSLYQNTVPLITPAELWDLKNTKPDSLYILDTREKEEFTVSHLENAIYVGYEDFNKRRMENIPRDATIVTYCTVGYRSEKIGEKLLAMGYRNVFNLKGSIAKWLKEGYPVFNPSGEETDEVHTYNKKWSRWFKKGKLIYD